MVLVATQVKRRRGTTAENDAFTGAEGEITVDTEKHELRVHDGQTQGGFKVGSGTGALIIGQILEVVGTADYTPVGCLLADGAEYTKAQFPDLWENFLTGTPKLQTCTYTEYANQIAEYGFCNKFAVDTTNETFKVPTRNKYRKLVKKIVNGTSWANIYDDGWCEQGGQQTSGKGAVNLLLSMNDTNYVAFTTNDILTSNYHSYALCICNKTISGFEIMSQSTPTAPSAWLVKGYASTIPDSTSNITREFVVVANGTLNQEQMDWSAWASSLAGRANIDASNFSSIGKSTLAGFPMPSDNSIDLTWGASGALYTAPADGYINVARASTGANQALNLWTGVNISSFSTASGQTMRVFAPISKGASFSVSFSSGTTATYLRFVYANGAK